MRPSASASSACPREVASTSAIPPGFCVSDGFVAIPQGPGLGIEVDEAAVLRQAGVGHRWRNPIWRHADGSFAEW